VSFRPSPYLARRCPSNGQRPDGAPKRGAGRSVPVKHLTKSSSASRQRKRRDESALNGTYRYVAAAQRHTRHSQVNGRTADQRSQQSAPSVQQQFCASGGSNGSGIAHGWAWKGWVISCAGIPSRRGRTRSQPGAGVYVVSAAGDPQDPPALAQSEASSPTRWDIRLVPRWAIHRLMAWVVVSVLARCRWRCLRLPTWLTMSRSSFCTLSPCRQQAKRWRSLFFALLAVWWVGGGFVFTAVRREWKSRNRCG